MGNPLLLLPMPGSFLLALIVVTNFLLPFADGQLLPELILDAYYNLRYTATDREAACRKWYANDTGTAHLNLPLPPCPPSTQLADADANFVRDGYWSDNAFYHPGADFCVRSQNNASSGRQQCCYKGADILLGPPAGGTEDARSDQLGHIQEDIHPWFLCCRGQSDEEKTNELCALYYEKRPSNNGSDYQQPS